MARKPLKVIINSAGRSPHATLRQLILNAILKMKKKGGCTKSDIRRGIERYYNCKLGKQFLGQMGRSLQRLVKEAQLHNHYARYQVVPMCVVRYNSLGVRQKRPHCFCINPRSRLRSNSRSRSKSKSRTRSRSRSRCRKCRSRRLTGLVGWHGRRRRRLGAARRRGRSRVRRGPAGQRRGRSRTRRKRVSRVTVKKTLKKTVPPNSKAAMATE